MRLQGQHGNLGCPEFRRLARTGRRSVLQAGAAGLLGLSLADLLTVQSAAGSAASDKAGFGRAKRCIFLFMWGGPSQLDTFDPKPQAPDNIRGPFKPITTRVPGLQISEHFQHLTIVVAKVAVNA